MTAGYGVLRAKPDRWVREDGQATPHLQVRALDESGQPWRIAVNVQSDTGSQVVYWLIDPLLGHPILAGLPALPSGFSSAAASPASALDFVQAPLFAWNTGTALPATGTAAADDLQDLIELHLQQCKDEDGEIFAFGVRFDRNLHKPIDIAFGNTDGLHGIHDIHFNQGNVGAHAGDNGPLQDGGLILVHPDRLSGIFLAFQTQKVPTDLHGNPTSQSQPISALIHGDPPPQPPPTPSSTATLYLERALLNPTGDDTGQEIVVIGNLDTVSVALQNWRLVDRNNRNTFLGPITIGPGASELVALDGAGAQLSNKGGDLALLDPTGRQVDSVAYTALDAKAENRFVRFHH